MRHTTRLLPFKTRAAPWWVIDAALLALMLAGAAVLAREYATGDLVIWGDHPGQFMRLWYALTVAFPEHGRVVDWVPLWYAGYPELQFYPPGHVLYGMLLNFLTLGRFSPQQVYNLIPATGLVLPAFTFFICLRVILEPLGRGAARVGALVGALLAVGFGAMWGGSLSIAIGMVGERLAFALVPLVLLAGWKLVERPGAGRLALATLLLAALALLHPFHAPAAVLAVLAFALGRRVLAARQGEAEDAANVSRIPWLAGWLLLSMALTAWWLAPLAARQAPYAAGLLRANIDQTRDWLRIEPVPTLLLAVVPALGVLAVGSRNLRAEVLALCLLVLVLPAWILFDHAVLVERLGITALDPIRFVAEFYTALLLLAGASTGVLLSKPLWRMPFLAGLLVIVTAMAIYQLAPGVWRDMAERSHLDERATLSGLFQHTAYQGLWDELRNDPAADGRVMFTSSYDRVRWDDELTTPTAIRAMTPYLTGRELIGGTFSHWAPVARLLWVGDPWRRVLPGQVELTDDYTIFGQGWDDLNPDTLFDAARALNVTTIVAGESDRQARRLLDASPHFQLFWQNDHYYLYHLADIKPAWVEAEGASVRLLERNPREWKIEVKSAPEGAIMKVKMGYYPLWHATIGDRELPLAPDGRGLQEITVPAGGPYLVTLTYREGPIEWAGFVLSAAALLLCLVATGRALRGKLPRSGRPESSGAAS